MNNLNVAKIQLNGSPYDISMKTNLYDLLNNLSISEDKVAIEVNGIIVEKSKYIKIFLKKGDKVEIVHFIGGG